MRPPHDIGPRWGEVGIHGLHRPREWDAVAAARAPDLPGDSVHFVALPDGVLLVEDELPDGALAPLAAAIEATLRPSYRAEAVRRSEDVWAVAARAIEVVELTEDPSGDELELTWDGSERGYRVDGSPSFGSQRELEQLAGSRHESYVVRGTRLDGLLWEISVAPL